MISKIYIFLNGIFYQHKRLNVFSILDILEIFHYIALYFFVSNLCAKKTFNLILRNFELSYYQKLVV